MPTSSLTPREALLVLGLSFPCEPTQVRIAWRRAAQKLHPDRNPGQSNAQAFIRAREAYELLRPWIEGASWESLSHSNGAPSSSSSPFASSTHSAFSGMQFSARPDLPWMEDAIHFFVSWTHSARWACEQLSMGAQADFQGVLGQSFLDFFLRRWPSGAPQESCDVLRCLSLEAVWAVRHPRILDLAPLVQEWVEQRATGALSGLFSTQTFSASTRSGVAFFLPYAILWPFSAPQSVPLPLSSFFSTLSERLFFKEGTLEVLELEKATVLTGLNKAAGRKNQPLAISWMESFPNSFLQFYKKGWFDFSHPLYATTKIDPYRTALLSSTVRRAIPDDLLSQKGIEWIGAAAQSAEPSVQQAISHDFEVELCRSLAFSHWSDEALTVHMKQCNQAHRMAQTVRQLLLPSWTQKILSFGSRPAPTLSPLWASAARGRIEEFERLIASTPVPPSPFTLERQPIPLVQWVIWQSLGEPFFEHFCERALLLILQRYSPRAFDERDALGLQGNDWLFLFPKIRFSS